VRIGYFKNARLSLLLAFATVVLAISLPHYVVLAAPSQTYGTRMGQRDFSGSPSAQSWDASVTATFSGGSDDAVFSVMPDATSGFDNKYDIPEPPPPNPPYVRAYFYYSGQILAELHRSCLVPENMMEWPLRIEYDDNIKNITLTWSVENIPSEYSVLLYRGGASVADMRDNDNYTFQAASGDYDFRIVVKLPEVGSLDVEVSISPSYRSGLPGAVINYTVTVKNTGTLGADNYGLTVGDNAGWGGNIWLDNYRLENIPQGENMTTTLRVRIPEDATGCTEGNIWVKATSQGDNTKSDNDSCIAHASIVRGVQVVISPSSQENENGGTLKYTVTVKNLGNVRENFQLAKGDNAGWTLSLDDDWLLVPKRENKTTKVTVRIPENAMGCTWDNIWIKATSKDNAAVFDNKSCLAHVAVVPPVVPPAVGVDVSISPKYQDGAQGETLRYIVTVTNTGDNQDTYDLVASDNTGWSPSLSKNSLTIPSKGSDTVNLSVTIPGNAPVCTVDGITVVATSRTNTNITGRDSCTAHVIQAGLRVILISITPENQNGAPGSTLNYTVEVTNGSNQLHVFDLQISGGAGWEPRVSPSSLTLAAGASGTSTLSVTVPSGVSGGSSVGIAVTAISRADPTLSDSASCIARVAVVPGVRVSISPSEDSGSPGATLKYTVTVANTGNVVDTYDLAMTDNAGWNLELSSSTLTISMGGSEEIMLNVTIPGNAELGTADDIIITATSQLDPNSISDSASCRAIAAAPSVLPLTVPLIGIAIIIIFIGGYLFLKRKGGRRRRVLYATAS